MAAKITHLKSVSIELALKRAVETLREDLQIAVDEGCANSDFTLRIQAEGRVLEGDIKMEFRLGRCYESATVEGGNLMEVLKEYKRRQGWRGKNQPLMISAS